MSEIYDYEEYQNQRVKVTYTNKRKYREENIVGLHGQVVKTTSRSIAVQIDGMYNAASSNGLYWFERSELDIIKEENRQKEIAKQKASIEKELKSEIEKMNNIALYEKMAKEHPENPRLAELVNALKELGE